MGSPLRMSSWAVTLRRMLERVMGLVSDQSQGLRVLGRRTATSKGGVVISDYSA